MVIAAGSNVTGWSQLISGRIIEASYVSYNTPLAGYLLLLLFVVISAILFLNAGIEISFIAGVIFVGVFATLSAIDGGVWFNVVSRNVMIVILAVELASVLYNFIVKTK